LRMLFTAIRALKVNPIRYAWRQEKDPTYALHMQT